MLTNINSKESYMNNITSYIILVLLSSLIMCIIESTKEWVGEDEDL